jgi:methionyl-tRNA formyltransferase
MLNVHPSLLPRWRGATPIERAIAAGDRETGVSIMRPTAELDAGPVCMAAPEPIAADDDYGSLSARLAELGGRLLVEALETGPECREQPDEGVTYADKIGPSDRRLDPSAPAERLARLVRALTPHVGAFVELAGGERLVVVRTRAVEAVDAAPGALVAAGDRLLLACAQGALELLEVRPAGAATMDAPAFLRGRGRALVQGSSPQPQQ